jgi:hypothetical protein
MIKTKTGLALYNMVQTFLNNPSANPAQFVDEYFELYKYTYMQNDEWKDDLSGVVEVFQSLFCITDQFCEDETIRDEYELDEAQLREQVAALIARIKV